MDHSLTKKEQYYMKEYDTAVQLTYHIDERRNKLTNFYLIFSGVAVSGVAIILKSEIHSTLIKNGETLVSVLLLITSILGYITVLGLARLRRVQLEHFYIIANIREEFIGEDASVIPLTKKTVPVPSHSSGSYTWLLLVMITSSSLFAFFVFLVKLSLSPIVSENENWLFALCSGLIFLLIQDISYFNWASYKRP